MSFCSYEEAWGSPFESDLKNEHVTKENDVPMISNNQKNQDELDGSNGMVETAPLRGALLGGAIPKEQWKTNEISENKNPSFEEKFDKKMDQLVSTIEKYTKGCTPNNNNESSTTNWTDILIFILLGIFSILILDMFFRFGKYIIQSKIQNNVLNNTSQISYETAPLHHMKTPQVQHMEPSNLHHMEMPQVNHLETQQMNHMEIPSYHINSKSMRGGGTSSYPHPTYNQNFYRN
tara:strand:+ start:362 stop:1063 length:702 start_codon:yes stop_codon:yes gene_type:complete